MKHWGWEGGEEVKEGGWSGVSGLITRRHRDIRVGWKGGEKRVAMSNGG